MISNADDVVHPRRSTSIDRLQTPNPILSNPDVTAKAGKSRGQHDGELAAAVRNRAEASLMKLIPFSYVLSQAVRRVEPSAMGLGPVGPNKAALGGANLQSNDTDLIECDATLDAQTIAVTQEWNFKQKDFDRLNLPGVPSISKGHPVGAMEARIMAMLRARCASDRRDTGLRRSVSSTADGIADVFESEE